MRNTINISILFCIQLAFGQVGIGTDSPTPGYQLDVAGSVLIQEEFKITPFTDETSEYYNFKFLTRLLDSEPSGEVAKLNLSVVNVAPITVFDYVFTNLKLDNVTSVNLQYDADKYVVGLSNFRYEGENIKKQRVNNSGEYILIGNFVSRTYVSNGTWHIEIRNRGRNSVNDNSIIYYVTLIVYDKKYFRKLETIEKNFGGQSTGQADSPF